MYMLSRYMHRFTDVYIQYANVLSDVKIHCNGITCVWTLGWMGISAVFATAFLWWTLMVYMRQISTKARRWFRCYRKHRSRVVVIW